MTYIPGYGPSMAKLVILGEQPNKDDEKTGLPFSGNAGTLVKKFIREMGGNPDECYYTYVLKQPTFLTKEERRQSLEKHTEQVTREIQALNPNCILGLGNVPLMFCTGNHGIDHYRGSIYRSNLGPKYVGTIHPYSLRIPDADGKVKSWIDSTYIKWDIKRALEQSKFSAYDPPRRNLIACRNSHQLWKFLERNKGRRFVAVDIETFKTYPVCISFAFNRNEAMSVPLMYVMNPHNEQQMTKTELVECWRLVAQLLADPEILKIGQNFKFDQRILERCNNDRTEVGLHVNGFFFDTNLAFKCLFPELSGKLEFMCSVLTEEPYYKDEGKEYNPKKDRLDRLLLYNAKDAVITYEVFEKLVEEMSSIECWPGYRLIDFFFDKVMPLHPFYSRLERRGIKRDAFMQRFLLESYTDKLNEAQERLDMQALKFWPDKEMRKYKHAKTGQVRMKRFNAGSTGKDGEMKKLIFGYMKCPQRNGTDEKTLDALARNAIKDPDKIEVLESILEVRKIDKVIGTYVCANPDYRGRFITSVRLTLETGRTSTNIVKSPVFTEPTGSAFQTLTKHGEQGADIRSMYVPDEGFVFFESDLSQAEARVVALLARDDKLKKMFDYGLDVHRVTTGWIDGTCPDDELASFFSEQDDKAVRAIVQSLNKLLKSLINDEQRQIGKKFRHAGHYDMGKREASLQAHVSEWKAGQILDKFHKSNPNIRGVFHKEIIDALNHNNRVLVTPHGRRRQFLNEWGNDLWKEAYANIPQGTVSDHLKFAAQRIEKRLPWIHMLAEAHDSFLAMVPLATGEQYPFKYLDRMKEVTKEEMEQPIDFRNCTLSRGTLVIPCDMAVGDKNWLVMEKCK